MSLSVKSLLDWLVTCSVPIAMVAAGATSAWKGVNDPVEAGPHVQGLPFFDFLIPEFTGYRGAEMVSADVVKREPFLGGTGAPVEETDGELLDLQQIQLGMIVVTGDVKLCLTNGRMMAAGRTEPRFTIEEISEQGVWYRTPIDRFFLTVGDKVSVDKDGTIHRLEEEISAEKQNESVKQITL